MTHTEFNRQTIQPQISQIYTEMDDSIMRVVHFFCLPRAYLFDLISKSVLIREICG